MRRSIRRFAGLISVLTAFAALIYLIQGLAAFGSGASPSGYLPLTAVFAAVSIVSAVLGGLVRTSELRGDA